MPFDLKAVGHFASDHPITVGIGAFVGGLIVLDFLGVFGGGGSSSSSGDSAATQAYFAAQAADKQSGDAVQIANIQAQAATTQTVNTNATNLAIQNTWASTQQAENASNNATAVTLAPYQTQQSLISSITALGEVAPVTTTTTTNSKSGGNGLLSALTGGLLGGSSSKSTTTTSQSANPNAQNALLELESAFGSGF